MISRRSPTGTGQPGRQEYRSRSRATLVTLAENFGGPVGAGVAVAGPAEGVGDAGAADGVDGTGGVDRVGCAGCEVAVAPHAATTRQPATAADVRIRGTNGDLLTGRHPHDRQRTSLHCI